MATQYTNLLKLALPTDGELDGTWGDVVNNNITSMIEEAVAGMTTINSWTANAASISAPSNGTTSPGRAAIIELTDTGVALTGDATLTLATTPASKVYVISNKTAQTVKVTRGSATDFVYIPPGVAEVIFCDGSSVFRAKSSVEGWNPALAYDLTGDSAVTSADSITYLNLGFGLSYSGANTETAFRGLEAAWTALPGTVETNCKFRVFPIQGNYNDVSAVRTGGNAAGYGDTTWVGNIILDGTSSRVSSGTVYDWKQVNIVANPDPAIYSEKALVSVIAGTSSVAPRLEFVNGAGEFAYITEETYSLTGTSIDIRNGGFQYKTISANTTFTSAIGSGNSVLLRIIDGDLFTITWPASTSWVGPNGNTPPTLTGNDYVLFFQIVTTKYAAYLGSAV